MIELRRRELDQQARQLDGRRVRRLEEAVVERQLEHLRARHVGELGAPVAQRHAPQARHAIEQPAPVRVVQVDALRARDDARALAMQRGVVGERMQMSARGRAPATRRLTGSMGIRSSLLAGPQHDERVRRLAPLFASGMPTTATSCTAG
jgi:hypothetical protein